MASSNSALLGEKVQKFILVTTGDCYVMNDVQNPFSQDCGPLGSRITILQCADVVMCRAGLGLKPWAQAGLQRAQA